MLVPGSLLVNEFSCSLYVIRSPHVPQCIRQMSHTAPFCNRNVHTCAHFCYKIAQCGIWSWCIVGFVNEINCLPLILVHRWMNTVANILQPTISNKSALAQGMVWRRSCYKPSPKPTRIVWQQCSLRIYAAYRGAAPKLAIWKKLRKVIFWNLMQYIYI